MRTLRKGAGLTLDDVAQLAGVSTNYLSRAENGLIEPTSNWTSNVVTAIGARILSKQDAA